MVTSKEIAQKGVRLVKEGKVRNHKLGNSARIHSGEAERRECQLFRDFLVSKNGCITYELNGGKCYGNTKGY